MEHSEVMDSAKMLAELALVTAANSLVSDATLISNSVMNISPSNKDGAMYHQAFWDLCDHIEKVASQMKSCFASLCKANGNPLQNC
jgi:hypothetical protein